MKKILFWLLITAGFAFAGYNKISGTPFYLLSGSNYTYWATGGGFSGCPAYYLKRATGYTDNKISFKVDVDAIADFYRANSPYQSIVIRGKTTSIFSEADSIAFFSAGGPIQIAWHHYLGPCNSTGIGDGTMSEVDGTVYEMSNFLKYAAFGYLGIDVKTASGYSQMTGPYRSGVYRLYTKGVAPGPDADGTLDGAPTITCTFPDRRGGTGELPSSSITFYGDVLRFKVNVTGCDVSKVRLVYYIEYQLSLRDTDYSQLLHNHRYMNRKSDEQYKRDQNTWAIEEPYTTFDWTGQLLYQARPLSTYESDVLCFPMYPVSTDAQRTALLTAVGANDDPTDWDWEGSYSGTDGNIVSTKTEGTHVLIVIAVTKNGRVAARKYQLLYHPVNYRYTKPSGFVENTVELSGAAFMSGGSNEYYWDEVDLNRLSVDAGETVTLPDSTVNPEPPNEYNLVVDAAAEAKEIAFTNNYAGWHDNGYYDNYSNMDKRHAMDYLAGLGEKRPAYYYWRPNNILSGGTAAINVTGGHPMDGAGYNFANVVYPLNYWINTLGLYPVISLGYMPLEIASCTNPAYTAKDWTTGYHLPTEGCVQGFTGSGYVSLPTSWSAWYDLIYNVTEEIESWFGEGAVRYQVWNEANHWAFNTGWINGVHENYGWGEITHTNYDTMFYWAAKAVDDATAFGAKVEGPDYSGVGSYHGAFVGFAKDNVSNLTGFTVHHYDHNPLNVLHYFWKAVNYTEDNYGALAENYTHAISETNPSADSHNTPQNCSRYAAAWMACLVDGAYAAADLYGAYFLPEYIMYCNHSSDYADQRGLYWNVSGTNIYKAPVRMNQLLSMMSTERIDVTGADFPTGALTDRATSRPDFNQLRAFATRSDSSLEVLIYSLNTNDQIHENYSNGDVSSGSVNAYAPYSSTIDSIRFQLTVSGVSWVNSRLRIYDINEEHADVVSAAARNGFPSGVTTLSAYSQLTAVYDDTVNTGEAFPLTADIQENSVRLYRLDKISEETTQEITVSKASMGFANGDYSDTLMVYTTDLDSTCYITLGLPDWLTAETFIDSLTSGDSLQLVFNADSTYGAGSYSATANIESNYNVRGVAATYLNLKPHQAYHVNCGGGAYTAANDTVYSADQAWSAGTLFGYSGGAAFENGTTIAGTEDDSLYLSERNSMTGYHFRVGTDTMTVILNYAEIWWTAVGKRVMTVAIEGDVVSEELDIYDEVGNFTAYSDTFEVVVDDGVLDITFAAMVNNAKISAIDVITKAAGVVEDTNPPQGTGTSRIIFGCK